MLLYVDAQYASPYAMSVFVALREKNLPFETHAVDLNAGENKAVHYAAASQTQRVPTLVHEGFALSESSAITEYLEELFPEPALYPREARARAKARQVQAWLRSDLMPIREERSTAVIFYGVRGAPLSEPARAAADKLFQAADSLLAADGENLFGAWSLADLDLALMLQRLLAHGDPVPARLAAYARRQWERARVQEWMQLARPPL